MLMTLNDPLDLTLAEEIERRCPVIGKAARQLEKNLQLPFELALVAVLTAVSTACQVNIDVRTPHGQIVPATLALLLIAQSGERKTSCLNRMMKPVMAFDDVMLDLHSKKIKAYNAKREIWKEEVKLVRARRRKAKKAEEDCDCLDVELADLLEDEPVPPKNLQLCYQDVSPLSLLEGMQEFGVAALISSEGGLIIDGKAFESVPHLNSAWSGDVIKVNRAKKMPIRISRPRLTTCIMVQPEVFAPKTGKQGEKIRGSGHWARYLVFSPESTQGTRLSSNAAASWEHVDMFNRRMIELLEIMHSRLDGSRKVEVIEFSHEAADCWTSFANTVERQMAEGGRYEYARDHASKLPENVARLAALLHYFEGFESGISLDTLKVAIDICERSSRYFLTVFDCVPQHESDAKILLEWLTQKVAHGEDSIEKNAARQGAPYRLREYGRFFEALEYLQQQGLVNLQKNLKGKMCIYFPGNAPPSASQLAVTGLSLVAKDG